MQLDERKKNRERCAFVPFSVMALSGPSRDSMDARYRDIEGSERKRERKRKGNYKRL